MACLGDGFVAIVGGVAQGDALAPGVFHVDLGLGSDAEVADHLQVGHGVQHFVGEVDPAPADGFGALAARNKVLGGREVVEVAGLSNVGQGVGVEGDHPAKVSEYYFLHNALLRVE